MTAAGPSPQLAGLVAALRRHAPRPGNSVDEQRANFEAGVAKMAVPDGVYRTPVSAGGVDAEWLVPDGIQPREAILYLHGGGYVIGSLATVRPMASQLALDARARVLTIDYRLAPEHPHPAALDDALAAYRWLLDEGLKPAQLAIAGDSAGGGLTVATLVALRDRALDRPAAAVCFSPWTDLSLSGASLDANAATDPQVQRWLLTEMAGHYLAGHDPRDPLVSPLYAELHGLPPLLIHAGRAEALIDDAVGLARAASDAGVDVTLECWDHMIHVWHGFAPVLPEATDALRRVGEWLMERWAAAEATGR